VGLFGIGTGVLLGAVPHIATTRRDVHDPSRCRDRGAGQTLIARDAADMLGRVGTNASVIFSARFSARGVRILAEIVGVRMVFFSARRCRWRCPGRADVPAIKK
jgi:hypothetical protein